MLNIDGHKCKMNIRKSKKKGIEKVSYMVEVKELLHNPIYAGGKLMGPQEALEKSRRKKTFRQIRTLLKQYTQVG